jgi:hypothetical protein
MINKSYNKVPLKIKMLQVFSNKHLAWSFYILVIEVVHRTTNQQQPIFPSRGVRYICKNIIFASKIKNAYSFFWNVKKPAFLAEIPEKKNSVFLTFRKLF